MLFAYLCGEKAKRTGDEIGEVSPRSGAINHEPISPAHVPTSPSLNARTVTSHPLRHARPLRQQVSFRLPRKPPQKGRHPLLSQWGRYSPRPIPFR